MVQTITNAIQLKKTPNAYLLTGIRGIGKTTIVRELIDRLVGNYPEHTDVIWWHSSKLEEFTEGEIKTTGLEAKPLAEVSNILRNYLRFIAERQLKSTSFLDQVTQMPLNGTNTPL